MVNNDLLKIHGLTVIDIKLLLNMTNIMQNYNKKGDNNAIKNGFIITKF